MNKKPVAILISGRGSNMSALIEATRDRDYPVEIVGVISNRADAKGLGIAAAAGIETKVIAPKDHPGKEALDAALDEALRAMGAEIVCLAGYMRLLTPGFVEKWAGRIINIHPSLLPLFKGLETHRRAIEAGMRVHGCTVHFVTAEMDDGPIIAQAVVPVLPADGEDDLTRRVLAVEHQLYPLALKLVAEGKARMTGGRTVFSGSFNGSGSLVAPIAGEEAFDIESLARMTP
ncbi:phosphoribosylglycinamide formyltransferase [Aquamicrobium sp. LC103]|uniref:phosphoribosylglycinamide formyltransferase n=1 Tax=Aquamicrobium sp. LC103 TaxID=1120658 RepID=UPI00063EB97D|nr:phosphoribosylglycinamide formyltransferase [Aquamicrobium sp. LC103]TKT81381.1 phosphoribosylglycinamide formyltransferase [Aquamicrobium sp. LC103]